MCKVANIQPPRDEIVRAMIYDDGTGVYLFLFDRREDGSCFADYWFGSLAQAEAVCVDDFAIGSTEWIHIPDPQSDCQHDWINPTRIKLDAEGNKLWGQFEPATDAL